MALPQPYCTSFPVSIISPYFKAMRTLATYLHFFLSQVGTTTEPHAHTDIDEAAAAGLDGFALNIGDPRQSYATNTISYMFDYAASNHPDFHLLFS